LFSKTLQSDVGESMAFMLLQDVVSTDAVFGVFDEDDLDLLSRYLSVLSFNAGDQIITKDEPASFCGIVLAGQFEAVLGDAQRVPLPKGSLIGEMAYFEGGRRTADIVAAEASVVALISFDDLKKLHPLEADVVNKFLHLLAVVSMRKLRSMLARAQGRTSLPTPVAAATPVAETAALPAEPASATGAAAPAAGGADESGAAAAAPVQESLFVARLKAESAQAKESAAAAAATAEAKTKQLSKAKREASYRAANLENKIKILEQENDTLREAARLAVAPAQRNKERVKLLTEQLAVMTKQKFDAEQAHVGCAFAYNEVVRLRDEATLLAEQAHVAQVTEMQASIIEGLNTISALRTEVAETSARLTTLTATYTDLCLARAALEGEHRMALLELQSLRAQMLVLQERVASLDKYRREFAGRLSEEEIAAVNWKSKAELYLGEHTRLKNRMSDLERLADDNVRDRRAMLRVLAQRATLIKKLVVRNFVRNVQTRRLVFELFARVHNVSAARLADESSVSDDSDASATLRLQRKERTRMMAALRSARTPVGRLVLLLDEELSAFESPFRALQAEGAQLRATLDAFFRRNIQLTASFVAAKDTYEALHREYARLRESWSKLHKREQEQMAAEKAASTDSTTAAAHSHAQASTLPYGARPFSSPSTSHAPADESLSADDPSSSPLPALPGQFPSLPTPAPWSPVSTATMRLTGPNGSYSATLSAMNASMGEQTQPQQQHLSMSLMTSSGSAGTAAGQKGSSTPSSASGSQTPRSITVVPSSASSSRPQSSPRPSPPLRPSAGATSAPVRPATAATDTPLTPPRKTARPLTSSSLRASPQASPTSTSGGVPAGWVPDTWPAAAPVADDDVSARSQALRARILASTTGGRPSSSPHMRPHAATSVPHSPVWGASPATAAPSYPPDQHSSYPTAVRAHFGGAAAAHNSTQQWAHTSTAQQQMQPPHPVYAQYPQSPRAVAYTRFSTGEDKQQQQSPIHAPLVHPSTPQSARAQQTIVVRPAAGQSPASTPYPHVQHSPLTKPEQPQPPQAWTAAWTAHAAAAQAAGVSGSPMLGATNPQQQHYDRMFGRK
jgi:CRP-like cAMP-binding protein